MAPSADPDPHGSGPRGPGDGASDGQGLAEDRALLAEAQRVARLGMWQHDLAEGRTTWSEELHRILGDEGAPSMDRYLAAVHPSDRIEFVTQWARVSAGEGDMATTHRVVRPDGEVRWLDARAWLADPDLVRGTVVDVTDLKRAEAALAHQALHDPLTGLPNRLLVTDRVEQALGRAAQRGSRMALAFVDIDRFKLVNEAVGHAAGDALLVAVAHRLRAAVGPGDTVGRFGADEFVVVHDDLPGWGAATQLARRLSACLEEPFHVDDRELFLSATVGVAVSRPGMSAEELLGASDSAVHRAKERGRGQIEVLAERGTGQAAARLDLEAGLRRAVDRDELWVAYQPIIDLADGRPVGVEALMRWRRSDGRVLPPDEFIPVAEDTGLIVPMGRWVLRRALSDLAAVRRSHPALARLFVDVNVSGRQLVADDLVAVVVEELDRSGLEPAALRLEVTESVLMEDVDRSVEVLAALRAVGVGMAVDDFGTGYSSLAYLKRLPLDTLKVDGSFVQGLGHDPEDSSIVDAITALGRALGLAVLAEGVEDERQREALVALGCQLAQGFLWSRPADRHTLARWLLEVVEAAPVA